MAAACAVLFLAQVIVVNHASNQRYEISQYLREYRDVQAEHQKLSVHAVELQSSERLSSESSRLNLVAVDSIRYIEAAGAVALGN